MKNKNLIVALLGGLLDKFKAKHAGVYFIILIVFGAINAVVAYLQTQGIDFPNWADTVVNIITWAYVILGGAHTPESQTVNEK